ncbi:helix-turn-helix domain-containing protein [Tundrisphaera sp. TA3]|uniref:helix-turn-helix domain-containing protein n=1 Tax=Tundrisphaera sp. TA3 TaxID=3435775 RepID=UPI003EBED26A
MARPKRKIEIEHEPIVGLFAARLREVRLSRGMTQIDLANRAVVTPTYIAKLEGGRVAPGIDLVARLAKALQTTISDLLPEAEPSDPLPLLREQAGKFSEVMKTADQDTLLMLVPLLTRLLESPTRKR